MINFINYVPKLQTSSFLFLMGNNTIIWDLERKILFRLVGISILVIFTYVINDFFLNPNLQLVNQSITGVVLYGILLILLFFVPNIKVVRWLLVSIFTSSVIAGFFTLGGFSGIAPFDFANILICLVIILSGKERILTISFISILFVVLFYVQISHPELIVNARENDPQWIDILEVFTRMILSINICLALKEEFLKEQALVKKINYELQEKNMEIISQNEEIVLTNEKLEEIIQERTRKIEALNEKLFEYAMFNSHKVRAPLARILGLAFLIELEFKKQSPNISDIEGYFKKINDSTLEMDTIIMDFNNLLTEKKNIFLNQHTN